jgi:DNA polymerase V
MPLDIFGHQMRNQVLKNTGLTVGVGIAQTKTLALYSDQVFLQ